MAAIQEYETSISRFYIDVRPLTPRQRTAHVDLPLLSTLPEDLQESIQKYLRPADRLMSLSSSLLKYYFIHKHTNLPWNQIFISRTPKPHRRPHWSPPPTWTGEGGLEFNVTHQNGLVGIVGCKTPTVQNPTSTSPTELRTLSAPTSPPASPQIRLGVDVACVHEEGRSPADITTQAKLNDWLDIFGEMFSDTCLNGIRNAPVPDAHSIAETMQKRLRRFYAFWALKEAYIKMVGEGLLADWLRKLEFENVTVPEVARREDWDDDGFSWALRDEEEIKWTAEGGKVRDVKAVLGGRVVGDVRLELVGYEVDYLFAVAMRGVKEVDGSAGAGAGAGGGWVKLDIEMDIKACANGKCRCLKTERGGVGVSVEDTVVSPVAANVLDKRQDHRIVHAGIE